MSTYVLMRILESAPHRYDLGIRLLSLGRLDRAYDRLASHIAEGQKVLDMGCGTGALTVRAARRGARVRAIDVNPEMLEIARRRTQQAGFADRVDFAEMGVAELDGEPAGSYDAVTSGLCLSELSDDELAFTLKQVVRMLRPGGLFLIADEVKPANALLRTAQRLTRAPLVALTYLVTQQTTHSVADLPGRLKGARLSIVSARFSALRTFVELVAQKPERTSS